MEDDWKLAFVLPNLRLPPPPRPNETPIFPPLEVGDVAIVPPEDPRVLDITSASRAAKKLVSGFVDHSGSAVLPCALIYRTSAPTSVDGVAMVAFRNAMALSLMLPSWITVRDDARLYSDVFDFYPTLVSGNDRLVTHTVGLTALFSDDAPFLGMVAPHVYQSPYGMIADYYIRAALSQAWIRRFQEGVDEAFYRTLFRSLEIAYLALATPLRNQGSMYEWGATVGLWVSALEILAHPSGRDEEGNVDQRATLELLGEYEWRSQALSRPIEKVTFGRGNKAEQLELNAIQLGARALYSARHKFQHGAPVDDGAMFPFPARPQVSVIQIAPAIYRTALHAFLRRRFNPEPFGEVVELELESPADLHTIRMAGETFRVENAVCRMLGLGLDDLEDE